MVATSFETDTNRFRTSVAANHLLEHVDFFRVDASRNLQATHRSELGQFFTPPSVARRMASMFTKRSQTLNTVTRVLRILDPGAGVGTLSAAYVAQVCQWEQKPQSVTVLACEIDPFLQSYLRLTLDACGEVCRRVDINFEYEVLSEDFITAGVTMLQGRTLFDSEHNRRFNRVIMNPPYRKINSNSKTRRLLRTVGIETSNLYTAFLWLTIELLQPGGEMVAITPRSFCNGPYFRPFRLALLESMALRKIHVFDTRDTAFQEDDVLQENIILHAVKTSERASVMISSSTGPDDEYETVREVSYDQLIQPDDPDAFIHIVPDELGHQIGQQMQVFKTSLDDLGLSVSTGRVVDFRAKSLLRQRPGNDTVPLIYPGHLSNGSVVWPRENTRKPNALALEPGADELLVPAGFYVLVKRFSAKEEKRRVVAAVYDPDRVAAKAVGFENHLNYYHCNGRGLPLNLAKGLAVFLNSTLVDQYFRQFNGHTQVNATDLRSLNYPSETELMRLGERIDDVFPEQDELDRIITEELIIMPDDKTPDPIQAKKKINEALTILRALNVPRAQQNERSALTLLALLDLKAETSWEEASDPLYGITEMMDYFREHFGVTYAPNTRETVRRQTVHQFVQMGLVLANPDKPRPINSPKTCYQIEVSALKLIRTYGTEEWEKSLKAYLSSAEDLRRLREKERKMALIPVDLPETVKLLNDEEITLTGGGQNVLINEILREFCGRFTPGGLVIYVDDAGQKLKGPALTYLKQELGVDIDEHGKMPDVIVFYEEKNWLVLIEAVTSHGPVDLKRHNELKELFKESKAPLVFVTAFATRRAMKQYLLDIAWETEVWVAESPSHLIHFNGERFLGPYD